MHSLVTTALCLSLIHTSHARVPHSFRDLIQRDAELEQSPSITNRLSTFFSRLFKRDLDARQNDDDDNDSTCYIDQYYNFVQDMNDGPSFCHAFIEYANVTTTVDYTPTSTVTVIATSVRTIDTETRTTSTSTVMTTVNGAGNPVKRNADAMITERGMSRLRIDEVFRNFRRQNGVSSSDGEQSISSGLSSACSCQDYTGPTVTQTYTDDATVRTLSAFRRTTVTRTSTRTGALRVTTTTVTLQSSASSSGAPAATTSVTQTAGSGTAGSQSSGGQPSGSQSGSGQPSGSQSYGTSTSASSSGAIPTAPAFSCPEDNNSTVSQMIDNRRYDYTVLCGVILTDSDFYDGGLNYETFGECVAACSVADSSFDSPVCRGVSYFTNAANSAGSNCFLKESANYTTSATGVDSALLQRVLLGVIANDTDGTTTENAPFSDMTPTGDPQQMSSMMSSMLANSSNTMPVITPPPQMVQSGMLVQRPFTAYSTYVSDGTTFSTGTASSFATTYANGSWVSYYYTSYTQTWASATTVYGATETGYTIANSSDSSYQQQSGNDGEYSTINTTTVNSYGPGYRDETTIITNLTYAANGTQVASTATTLFNHYETGGANAGGAAGGPGSGGPSDVSATATSSDAFSTITVISNSGGTGGASSFQTGGVYPLTTIVSTGGTAYTTVIYVTGTYGATGRASSMMASEGSGGTGGASSMMASGGPGGTGGASSVAASGGPGPTGGESSNAASGGPGGTGGASSGVASGGPTSPISIGSTYGQTAGSSVVIISGGPTGTGDATSNVTSGGPTSPFTNSRDDRSGTTSTTTSSNSTAPTGTGSTSIPLLTGTSGIYTGPPPSTASTNTSTGTFTNSRDDRSGTTSTTTSSNTTSPTGTQPTLSTGVYGYPTLSGSSPGSNSSSSTPPPTGLSSYQPPSGTGSTSTGTFTNTNDNRSPFPSSSAPHNSTAPPMMSSSGIGPGYRQYPPQPSSSPPGTTHANGTSTGTFTNTNDNRSPYPTSSTTSSIPPPLTTGPSTCVSMTMGTTTLYETTTILGCDSTCMPWGGGYYGGGGPPATFGPPVWETSTSEEASATVTSRTETVVTDPAPSSEPETMQTSTVTSTATS